MLRGLSILRSSCAGGRCSVAPCVAPWGPPLPSSTLACRALRSLQRGVRVAGLTRLFGLSLRCAGRANEERAASTPYLGNRNLHISSDLSSRPSLLAHVLATCCTAGCACMGAAARPCERACCAGRAACGDGQCRGCAQFLVQGAAPTTVGVESLATRDAHAQRLMRQRDQSINIAPCHKNSSVQGFFT